MERVIEYLKNVKEHSKCEQMQGYIVLNRYKNNQVKPAGDGFLFEPLTGEEVEILENALKCKLPHELVMLYSFTDGFDLFSYTDKMGQYWITSQRLSIFGLRIPDMKIPFDIIVEGVYKRVDDYPEEWQKFGSVDFPGSYGDKIREYDLYIELDETDGNNRVHMGEKTHKEIIHTWKSLGDCLSGLFDYFEKDKAKRDAEMQELLEKGIIKNGKPLK